MTQRSLSLGICPWKTLLFSRYIMWRHQVASSLIAYVKKISPKLTCCCFRLDDTVMELDSTISAWARFMEGVPEGFCWATIADLATRRAFSGVSRWVDAPKLPHTITQLHISRSNLGKCWTIPTARLTRQPGWATTILDQTVFRNQTPNANDQRSNAAFSAECRSHFGTSEGFGALALQLGPKLVNKSSAQRLSAALLSVGRDQQLPSSRWAVTLRSPVSLLVSDGQSSLIAVGDGW